MPASSVLAPQLTVTLPGTDVSAASPVGDDGGERSADGAAPATIEKVSRNVPSTGTNEASRRSAVTSYRMKPWVVPSSRTKYPDSGSALLDAYRLRPKVPSITSTVPAPLG